jgi:hypothetical protein
MVSDMNLGKVYVGQDSLFCDACKEDKQHRVAFPNEGDMQVTRSLGIVHSNMCGPMRTTSMGNARYVVTFIDHFSKKVCLYVLRFKEEVF